jgi:hypothetical protein
VDGFSQPSRLALGVRTYQFAWATSTIDEEGRPTAPGYDAAGKAARTFSRIVHAHAVGYLMVGQARTSSLIIELAFFWKGHRDSN